MKKYKQLTPKEYDYIRGLLAIKGIKGKILVQITGRSYATIGWIKKFPTLDEYHAYFAKRKEEAKEKQTTPKTWLDKQMWNSAGGPVQVKVTTNETDIMESLIRIETLLNKLIAKQSWNPFK